jgi:hypothetical protein
MELNAKTGRPKISSRGGARPGAGRKPGSRDNVTVKHLLEVLDQRSGGRSYEELLVEDFLQARQTDTNLAMKYHHLIGNKLLATISTVEITDTADAVAQRAEAFAAALRAVTENRSTKDK